MLEADSSMVALSGADVLLPPALPGIQENSYNYVAETLELRGIWPPSSFTFMGTEIPKNFKKKHSLYLLAIIYIYQFYISVTY